jgi:hypothetical protein
MKTARWPSGWRRRITRCSVVHGRWPAGFGAVEVVARMRVPVGKVAAYAGELSIKTEQRPEVGHVSCSACGVKSVDVQPIEIARGTLEQRLGTLPEPPVVAPGCAGNDRPRSTILASRTAPGCCSTAAAPRSADRQGYLARTIFASRS